MTCILCSKQAANVFYSQNHVTWQLYGLPQETDKPLLFYRCSHCGIVFKDPKIRLSLEEEKKRYLNHENEHGDPNYEKFLMPLVEEIARRVANGARGIDFGCGLTKVTEELFQRRGLNCVSYDPYFFPDKTSLNEKYDFISCSEAAEHFCEPEKEFEKLFRMLNPYGILGIKTVFVPSDFANWWYHKDPTHVTFYSQETFQWLADKHSRKIDFLGNNISLFF